MNSAAERWTIGHVKRGGGGGHGEGERGEFAFLPCLGSLKKRNTASNRNFTSAPINHIRCGDTWDDTGTPWHCFYILAIQLRMLIFFFFFAHQPLTLPLECADTNNTKFCQQYNLCINNPISELGESSRIIKRQLTCTFLHSILNEWVLFLYSLHKWWANRPQKWEGGQTDPSIEQKTALDALGFNFRFNSCCFTGGACRCPKKKKKNVFRPRLAL